MPYRVDEPAGGTPAAPPVDLPPLVGADLAFAEGYQERVGEYAAGSTFKNLGDVFKSQREGQTLIGQLQTEKASFATQLEEAAKTGAKPELPADVGAYKEALQLPEMPDGVELSAEILDKGIAYALEKGYPPEVLSDFLAFDLERASMEAGITANAQASKIDDAKAAIIAEVGAGSYEATIGDARHVSEALGLPLDADDLIGQPNMVVALSKLRNALSEGTLRGASVGGTEITAGGKLTQAQDIVSNAANPLHAAFGDNSHPQHANAQATYARLITESAS